MGRRSCCTWTQVCPRARRCDTDTARTLTAICWTRRIWRRPCLDRWKSCARKKMSAPFRICAALLLATAAWAQGGRGFLGGAFAADQEDRGLLLSPDMPRLAVLLANRPAVVKTRGARQATLSAPDSEALLETRLAREGPFEYCRIRPASGSSLEEHTPELPSLT